MKKMAKIYVLANPSDGSVHYVGCTTTELTLRYNKHIYDARHRNKVERDKWIKSLLDNGLSPSIHVIDSCNEDLADEKEINWIKYFKYAGYSLTNLTEGGKGPLGRIKSTEEKKLSSKTRREKSRCVYQFDLSGALLKSYPNAYVAAESLGVDSKGILRVVHELQRSFGGYLWSFEDCALQPCKSKIVSITAYKGVKEINTYNTCEQASKALLVDPTDISRVLSGKYKQSKGYTFKATYGV